MHETDAPGADHTCMGTAWASHGYRMHTVWNRMHTVWHRMCIASCGLTDVENSVGQSHADRASLGGGGAGAARAGQLQRMDHGQRHRDGAHAHASWCHGERNVPTERCRSEVCSSHRGKACDTVGRNLSHCLRPLHQAQSCVNR